MSENITKPRGTQDFCPDKGPIYREITRELDRYFTLHGIKLVDIPMFEQTKLFIRTVGDSTDVVNKELFDLVNKGESQYSLRPEFTAGIVRMFIENKLYASPDLPYKFGYHGSMFRYERPQKGRYREVHQGGVEILDKKLDIFTTVDCICLFHNFAKKLLNTDNLYVSINHIGCDETREKWKQDLRKYFKKHLKNMCPDCQRRFEQNPLRILDCKVEDDIKIASNAPTVDQYLLKEEKNEFELICSLLTKNNIKIKKDPHLVRGLDYYTGVVFELYQDNGDLQLALGGGGKYQNLVKNLGGPDMEGIGFSYGLDRLMMVLSQERKDDFLDKFTPEVFLFTFNKTEKGLTEYIKISNILEQNNISFTYANLDKNLSSTIKQADREKAKYLLILNEDLTVTVKNLLERTQVDIKVSEIAKYFERTK